MSLLGFDIGVRALLAAQSRLETIGHNLANASTPGYSRQRLLVSASTPLRLGGLLMGTGVNAESIQRAVDSVLGGHMSLQMSSLGRLDANLATLSQAEAMLGGTSASGPAVLLESMLASLSTLASAADDEVLRSSAVQSAAAFAGRLNLLANDVDALERTLAAQLSAGADRVNQLAQRISVLNREIESAEFSTSTANDLRDQRDEAIRELSSYADVRAFEDESGGVRVLIGGHMLVGSHTLAKLDFDRNPIDGSVSLKIGGTEVEMSGGQIGGQLGMLQSLLPKLAGDVDAFARNLIYEINRVHATGVGLDGPYQTMRASLPLADQDGDGNVNDELLANAGLPFAIQSGELVLNVTDRAAGTFTTHRLQIDTTRTTVGAFVAAIDGLPHMSAELDATGRLRLQADTGYGFDFAARLENKPDRLGSFGGGHASLGSASDGPFALAAGDTLDITGPLGTFSIAFVAGSFVNIGAATAAEVADVLNANASFTANGLRASTVGGSLVVQSVGTGAAQSFTVQGGTSLGAFGWGAGQIVSGSNVDASPMISGAYTGANSGAFVFRPNMDGAIGTTSGLVVEVFDQNGTKLADLQVGAGYQPGDKLDVADGIQVAFGYGELSATDHDSFRLELIADSDTARALPALGLNSFFDGLDAGTIAVRGELVDDPDLLAAARSDSPGDASNLLALLAAAASAFDGLDGATPGERMAQIAGELGFELAGASDARDAEQLALDSLVARRDQISGVNTDEELVNMLEQQQAYAAAAQFLRVVNDITAELLQIL